MRVKGARFYTDAEGEELDPDRRLMSGDASRSRRQMATAWPGLTVWR